ncbi:MAG: DeoR/GlpR transcriptional regulator [Spirochaetales bacterium]|nr:DeoR/GlpR transcriptional regulator [Spirochaetales bacterium]
MFAAQRIEIIKDFLIKNKTADISTLTSILNVSDVTVRKDLDKLEKDKFLLKIHGGAVLCETETTETISRINISNHTAKSKIAELALTLIEEDDSIFIGPGSTCFLLSQNIKRLKGISVVTNNVAVSNEVMGSIKRTYLLGGELKDINGIPYTSDAASLESLSKIFVNKAFISIDGIDLKAGITCNTLNKANLINFISNISKTLIVLADNEKFDHIGMYQAASLESISCVVTNRCDLDEYKRTFFEKNIKLLTTFDI